MSTIEKAKREERARLEAQVAAFVAAGGRVQKLRPGESSGTDRLSSAPKRKNQPRVATRKGGSWGGDGGFK